MPSIQELIISAIQQKREYDAGFVQKQFETSWKGGNQALKIDDLV